MIPFRPPQTKQGNKQQANETVYQIGFRFQQDQVHHQVNNCQQEQLHDVPDPENQVGEFDSAGHQKKYQLADYDDQHPEENEGTGIKKEFDSSHLEPGGRIEGRINIYKDQGKNGDKHYLGGND
jgi:hypothetical protein